MGLDAGASVGIACRLAASLPTCPHSGHVSRIHPGLTGLEVGRGREQLPEWVRVMSSFTGASPLAFLIQFEPRGPMSALLEIAGEAVGLADPLVEGVADT
jgi:hypothetical protein